MNEFNIKALNWEKNPEHIERTQAVFEAMLDMIPVNRQMNALEFGAGTGLLSFALQKSFAFITLMDSSEEMIRIAQEKIDAEKITNMKSLCLDLEKEDYPGAFDIIYNQMVLHHIQDIKGLFNKFFLLLNHGGFLAIADLFKEDGTFHGEGFTGHKGFDVSELSKILKEIGFINIKYRSCHIQKKKTESGLIKKFPLFLLVAGK